VANTLVNSTLVTKEAGFGYDNKVRFIRSITHKYDKSFSGGGDAGKVGDTIFVRMPVRFEPKTGQAYQQQAIYEYTVPVTMEEQFQVGMGWSSQQWALDIAEVKKRYIDPAVSTMANQADVYAYNKVFKQVANFVGSPGSAPSSLLTYMTAVTKLVNGAVDDSDLRASLSPVAMATIANANATLFHPAPAVTEAYRTGMQQNDTAGIAKWYREPNVQSYTTGTFTASTPLVNGANQTGSSLITDGWASGATSLKQGDTFTIGGVFSLNPLSYTNTGQLQNFVITADISDTAGAATLSISPSIITTGVLRNVSNSPANNAVITVTGATAAAGGTLAATTSPQGLIYHEEAFCFVTVDLPRASSGDCQFYQNKATGSSIRFWSGYDYSTDQNPSRLDMLGGAAALQIRGACRVYC